MYTYFCYCLIVCINITIIISCIFVAEAITNVKKMVDIASTLTVYLKDARARVSRKNKASDHEICDLDGRVKSKHKCKRNLSDSDSD